MNLRKKLSLIMSITVIFSMISTQVLMATPSNPTTPSPAPSQKQTIVRNEFNDLKELQKKSPEELKSLGLSDTEIKNAPNWINEYKQKLKERSKLSEQELKGMGYTDTQVQTLKATQDTTIMTDVQAMALSATLTLDTWVAYYYYDSNADKTRLRTTLDWSWSSKPIMQFYDLVAIAWSGGFIQDSDYDGGQNYHRIHYLTSLGSTESNYAWSTTPGQGCSHTFQLAYLSGQWAQSGHATASSFANGYVADVGISMVYGHSVLSITPSISISGGSISLAPTSIEKTQSYGVYSL